MFVRKIDKKQAEEVLLNKEILSRVSPLDANIQLKEGLYIGGFVGDKLVAVGIYFDRGWFDSVHVNVLKEFRGKYAVIFGKKMLEYSNKPLFTNIPKEFKDVVRFVEYFKFELAGERKNQLIYRRF